MPVLNTVHVADTVDLEVIFHDVNDVAIDVSGATTKSIILIPPSGPPITKAASFSGTGVDGAIKYPTINTDLNMTGTWGYQGRVVLPGPKEYSTDTYQFKVSGKAA
jgi:hypothetical protein